jgi:hypothetical protein
MLETKPNNSSSKNSSINKECILRLIQMRYLRKSRKVCKDPFKTQPDKGRIIRVLLMIQLSHLTVRSSCLMIRIRQITQRPRLVSIPRTISTRKRKRTRNLMRNMKDRSSYFYRSISSNEMLLMQLLVIFS